MLPIFLVIFMLISQSESKCDECPPNQKCCQDTCYDPVYASCCQNVISPKVTADDSCCGTESFNSARDLCCRNEAIVPKCGLKAKCCGVSCQNPDIHMCCQNTVVAKCAGANSACCGEECYDNRNFKCQGKSILPK